MLEDYLSSDRLKAVAKMVTKASGGPAISLPDGTEVTRDVIVHAVEEFTTRERADCLQLTAALTDPRVHIRYGALVALQIVTGAADPDFQPFQSPDTPANREALRRWQERCGAAERADAVKG